MLLYIFLIYTVEYEYINNDSLGIKAIVRFVKLNWHTVKFRSKNQIFILCYALLSVQYSTQCTHVSQL